MDQLGWLTELVTIPGNPWWHKPARTIELRPGDRYNVTYQARIGSSPRTICWRSHVFMAVQDGQLVMRHPSGRIVRLELELLGGAAGDIRPTDG